MPTGDNPTNSVRERFYDIFQDISQDTFANIAKVEPKCALCRKPVESFRQDRDFARQGTIFTAECHGRAETRGVTIDMLQDSAAVSDFLSEWFREDRDKIDRDYSFISDVSSSYNINVKYNQQPFVADEPASSYPVIKRAPMRVKITRDSQPKLKQEKQSSISLQPKKRMVGFE